MDKRRMCPNCRAFITADDKFCPYCEVQLGPRAIDRRSPPDLLGGIPHVRFTTLVILLLNAVVYIAMVLASIRSGGGAGLDFSGRTLVDFGAKYSYAMLQGQWWRLITAGFLHGGLLHILMNSWALFNVGPQVEESFGTSRHLVIYFTSTVTGFLASFFFSDAISVGASAGIFGLIGAMIAVGLRDRSGYGAAIRNTYVSWAVLNLVLGFIGYFAIDNAAHIGGLAGGFGAAFLAGAPGFRPGVERTWQILAGASVAATALAFGIMVTGLLQSG